MYTIFLISVLIYIYVYMRKIERNNRNKKSEKHWMKYYSFFNDFIKQDTFNHMVLIGDKIVSSTKNKKSKKFQTKRF